MRIFLHSSLLFLLSALSLFRPSEQVLGGEEPTPEEKASLVKLVKLCPSCKPLPYISTGCSGVFLNRRWILTAAHCFRMKKQKNPDIRDFFGFLGTVDWRDSQAFMVRFDELVIHPLFDTDDPRMSVGDIALLRLKERLDTNKLTFFQYRGKFMEPLARPAADQLDAVVLLSLMQTQFPSIGSSCLAMGFGYTGPEDYEGNVAKKIQLTIGPCTPDDDVGPVEMVFCTTLDNDRGLLPGDSGGPIFCPSRLGLDLAGIASVRSKYDVNVDVDAPFLYAPKSKPAPEPKSKHLILKQHYSRVSYYADWIRPIIRSDRRRM